MKILVVDDSRIQRKVIIQIIANMGFNNETLQAENGEDAIQVLAAHCKDICLILCDWNMPKMTGFEFITGVAKVPSLNAIPIIMVSVEGTDEKIAQAKAVHPNLVGYVTKPFTPDQLKAAIEPILNKPTG